MTAAHLCLGVGACADCDPSRFALIELRVADTTPEDLLRKVRALADEMPGVEVHRPIEAQASFLDDDVEVTVVLRIVDASRIPEEQHPDPVDGPSIPAGILDAFMEHFDGFRAGSSGWVRADWGVTV